MDTDAVKIAWISADWSQTLFDETARPLPGGAGWYRCALPAAELAKHGHTTVHLPNFAALPTGEIVPWGWDNEPDLTGYDVIVFQRWMQRDGAQVIRRARATGQVVLNDADDYFDGLDPANAAFLSTHPKTNPEANRDHYRAILAASDAITCSTPFLVNKLAKLAPTFLVRNAIDLDRWPMLDHEGLNQGELTVGWVGATGWRSGDLETLRGVLGPFLRRHNLRFVHHGARADLPNAAELLGLEPDLVGPEREMVSIADYPSLFEGIHIGLAPLRDSSFNQAKCLDASTRVCSERGLVVLRDISPGDRLWNDGRWTGVEAVERQLPRPGLSVTTLRGHSLKMTPEHRLWVNGGWVRADSMTVGDLVAMQPETVGELPVVRCPWPSDGRKTRGGDVDPLAFIDAEDAPAVTITPRWGRWLGLFAGDGSISGKTSISISCDGQDSDLIRLVMDDLEEMGLHPGTEAKTTWDGVVLRRRSVRVASAHLARFLLSLGVGTTRPDGRPLRVVTVPEAVWRSGREVIAAFLSGYFEADGCVVSAGVEVSSKDHAHLVDVQRLLLSLGVVSILKRQHLGQRSPYRDRVYWKLRLNRASTDVFAKEVGFLSERKQTALAALVAKPHSNAYRPMQWDDEIVSIEPCWVEPVDVQVEGSVFSAAGFVSHNSAIKGQEYAAAGIPFVAQATGEYRWFDQASAAARPKDWIRRLNQLVDPEFRSTEAKRVRALVEPLDIALRWIDWEQAYTEVCR